MSKPYDTRACIFQSFSLLVLIKSLNTIKSISISLNSRRFSVSGSDRKVEGNFPTTALLRPSSHCLRLFKLYQQLVFVQKISAPDKGSE